MDADTLFWKRWAIYLASCHAATAEYDGSLKSTSKARSDRFRSICRKAVGMFDGEHAPIRMDWEERDVRKRVKQASQEGGEVMPEAATPSQGK